MEDSMRQGLGHMQVSVLKCAGARAASGGYWRVLSPRIARQASNRLEKLGAPSTSVLCPSAAASMVDNTCLMCMAHTAPFAPSRRARAGPSSCPLEKRC